MDVDPKRAYDNVHDLQNVIVRKRGVIPGVPTLKVLPKDVNDFITQYPRSYANEHPPAPCRLDDI